MALSDFFNNATVSTRPDAGALTAQKLIAASSITVDTTAGWPVSPDSVHFIIYQVDASGNKVAGTQTDWKGTVTSSTAIGSLTLKAGTDQIYPVGSKVIATPTGAWADDMVTGLLVAHEQDGTLKAGAVDVTAVIADGIVTRAKLATAVSTELNDGWTTPTQTVSSVTNNGNKSYDVVFNSTVANILSPGMRLRTTRTVTAPTQCADLEASSSQYFSSASPAGLSFTTTFTCSAWVKLESYALGGIIARRNADTEGWDFSVTADGRLTLTALRIAANNKFIASYQSLPLNKWVHVAATMDVSAGDTTAQKIWMDGVEVPRAYTLTGVCAALVQGTTALVVGAQKSAGTNPFDGKIAQAAVFSSQLSDATVKAMQAQTLSGSETNLVSAFSCSNTLLDLNTTNNNDLTQSGGAAMTATDSPFGQDSNGVTAGTTDYALVMKVSTTTATVQVPEGCTIPTSGGVSAVAYSTATSPFGFTLDKGRWEVTSIFKVTLIRSAPAAVTYYNVSSTSGTNMGKCFTLPVGAWDDFGYDTTISSINSTQVAAPQITFGTSSSAETDAEYTQRITSAVTGAGSVDGLARMKKRANVSAATDYYLLMQSVTASATQVNTSGTTKPMLITAVPAGV